MATTSFTTLLTEILAVAQKLQAEGKAALPVLETLQSVLTKLKPFIPAADAVLYAESETLLAAAIAFLSKV